MKGDEWEMPQELELPLSATLELGRARRRRELRVPVLDLYMEGAGCMH